MKQFMDKDFLLTTETAEELYHNYAAKMPIIDYHCHINPEEIAKDKQFDNITQVWLGGDHYKWRLMRANGVDETFITGDAPDREKFQKWAETLPKAIGNPLYHWSHMELQRYFGYMGALNADTAEEVWNLCNEKLAKPEMSVRNIILQSNVKLICTTDDPIDTLDWHKQIAADESFPVKVLPAWRPDKAVNIEKPEFTDYLNQLSASANQKIDSFSSLCDALKNRMEYFNDMGCLASDHGLDYVMYQTAPMECIEDILRRRLHGEALSYEEQLQYKTAILLFLGKEYNRLHWVMQLHYGTKRNNNSHRFESLGPDTGFDCINTYSSSAELTDFLNALDSESSLPKTIVYSLNPNDNYAINTIIGCFQSPTAVGKLQHGSAWWYNDHKTGMTEQMTALANIGLLGNFIGMLTDSRSFLSYTRHEYFRRILCDMLGNLVENGEYPADMKAVGKIAEDISFNNCLTYFEFER